MHLRTLILRGVGALGVSALAMWHDSVRYALAIMFAFTGIAHVNKMRRDLAKMIPSFFPQLTLIVFMSRAILADGASGVLARQNSSTAINTGINETTGPHCYARRNVSSVISGGTPIRTGKPKVPSPRFT
jgi:hypothetical protein